MADDIKIKLGLDVGQLFTDLSKVTTQLNQVAVSADKAETEIKQLDAQKVDIDTSGAKSALDSLAAEAKSTGGGITNTFKSALNPSNLTSGIVGGLAGGLATAGIGTAISAVQGLGTAIFEGALRADEFGDKLEVAFTQQGIADVEGEINKVRESTLQLANDLGLPTERTRELAGTVATLGGVSGKQAEDLTKLSAGIETFTDGTVKGEAVVKAFSRGLADPEGAAAIESLSKKYPQLAETLKSTLDPTEKLAEANKILGTSFETVAAQQSDAGGTFNKLSNTVNEAFETIGSGLNNAINALIPLFTESLGPAFSSLGNTISELFTRVWSVLEPILGLIGGGIMVNIVGMISVAVEALNAIYETAVYAFDQIMLALAPVFNAIKSAFGMDGAVGEGVDAMEIMQGVLNAVSGAIGGLFDVIGDVAKGIVDVFVGALKLAIEAVKFVVEGIKSFIFFIGDLISKIPGVSTVFNNLKSAFDTVYNFFSDLPRAINEVQVYLKAIGMTFQTVFGILKESFTAALNLDFEGAANKLGSIFQSQTWVSAFSSNLAKARSELKSTTEAAKQAGQEIAKTEAAARGGGGGGKGGAGGRTPKETESDLQELKRLYADYAQSLVNDDKEILATFKGTAEERKAKEQELAQVRAQKLKEYLNTSLADVKDFDTVLSKEQLTLKIKPDKAKNEDFEDIRSFYLGETEKLGKDLNVQIKVKTPDFKDTIKEFETVVKDVEKNADILVPKVAAVTQEAFDQNLAQGQKYIDFIKAQNAEIETAKAEAIASGNQAAVESFDAQIALNIASINLLQTRLDNYTTQSKDAIAQAEREASIEFQIQKALQTSILDVFNTERLRKEKETNDAIRAERLGALDQEENDLNSSLAKREISFEEYAAKMSEVTKARQDAMQESEITFAERLKEVQDKTIGSLLRSQSVTITKFVTDQFTDASGNISETGKIAGDAMTQLTTQFAALAESGKATLGDFGKAAAAVAFDAVSKMIPSFVAGILGSSITALGPVAGPIAAGILTASLQLLIGQAKAALGFKDGVVDLAGPGTETSDSIPAWLSRGESVITASSTRANKEELAWMNANPGMSIKDYFAMQAPAIRYSVTEDGDLIKEVRKLREETRGLGKHINRNTHVEISGVLKADNNSIKAMIDNDRRRIARRG
jgi:hypothetical protein